MIPKFKFTFYTAYPPHIEIVDCIKESEQFITILRDGKERREKKISDYHWYCDTKKEGWDVFIKKIEDAIEWRKIKIQYLNKDIESYKKLIEKAFDEISKL